MTDNTMLKILFETQQRLKQTETKEMTSIAGGSFTIGDLLYANSISTLARLADVAAGSYLRSGGVGAAPLWSTLTLPNAATLGDLLTATGANAVGVVADVATGNVLRSGGVGVLPAYGKVALTTDVTNYVEGNWTPVLAGTGTAGSWTYTTQIGRYTRIGNRVLFNCTIVAATRPGAPTGNATITGLPLTSEATANNLHVAAFVGGNLTLSATNTMAAGRIQPSTTVIEIIEMLGTAPVTLGNLAATGLTATAVVECAGHYMV